MDAQDQARRTLVVQSTEPFNAEPTPGDLIAWYVTPTRSFYIRSHGPVPALRSDHVVQVGSLVGAAGAWTPASPFI